MCSSDLQKRLIEQRPDLPMRLLTVFENAKREAYRSDPRTRAIFPEYDLEVQRKAFGDDPYPYGFRANRQAFELVAEQLQIDGILREQPDLDSLVAESVRTS